MALKESLLSLLALCFMTSTAHALCADNDAVERARNALNIAANARSNGVANNYDYLMAEKSFLELKICLDYGNSNDPDDLNGYPSLKALASNTVARLAIVQTLFRNGSASQAEVDLVSAEKNMRSQVCSGSILKEAQARASNGVISLPELQTVKDTCAILK